jgi:hypothetical protein
VKESRLNNKIKRSKWAATRANAALNNLSNTDVDALIAQYLIDNPVGGSVGKIVAFESGSISAGASGDVLTRTATGSRYFKINYLLADVAKENDLTLTINGVDVFSDAALAENASPALDPTSSNFGVSSLIGATTLQSFARILPYIYCTTFTLTKDTGSTVNPIQFAYETLEDL